MKCKCDQCGTVFENGSACPVCGAEMEEAESSRSALSGMDRESFWQEVKYSGAKTESDK